MAILVCAAVAVPLLICLSATYWIRRRSIRRGFLDRPGGHKQHRGEVALGGGLAIAVAVYVTLGAGIAGAFVLRASPPGWLPELIRLNLDGIVSKTRELSAVLGCGAVLVVMGWIDDRRPLGPWSKFAVQIVVALVTAWWFEIRLLEFLGAPLSIVATTIWIVLITNAFNFLDNMDGLSAGVAAIAGAIFAVSAMTAGQLFVPVFAWILVGAALGFLWFNFSPASIFMGDTGSLLIGYLLAVIGILTTFYDPRQGLRPYGVLVPAVVLAVPLYDVASVVVRRIRAGTSPFRGDRRHFSHRLVSGGLSERNAVLTIYLATATTASSAIILPRVDWPAAAVIFAQTFCVVVLIAVLELPRRPAAEK